MPSRPAINEDSNLTFLVIILWAVALLTPVRDAARSQARSNISKPHEEYDTFSTIFRASSLNFHITGIFMFFLSLVTNKLSNNSK